MWNIQKTICYCCVHRSKVKKNEYNCLNRISYKDLLHFLGYM